MNQGTSKPAAHLAVLVLLPLVLLLAGCRSNCDLVEAELRTRETQIREIRGELFRLESHNDALQRELCDLRRGPARTTPELASQVTSIQSLTLGRSTGGLDDDGCPGDEALQALVEPRDGDNHVIKAPGSVHLTVVQITKEGAKQPLAAWDVPPEELRRSWRSGLFTTGYYLTFRWKTWPTAEKLRVTAQFTLADGRYFEADKDVTVRLTPASERKAPPAVEPVPGPPLVEDPGPVLIQPQAYRAAAGWQPPPLSRAVHIHAPVPTP